MSDNTLVQDTATDATDLNTGNQAHSAKTYTQDEVDNMMARMKGSLEKKLLKPYAELGDPEQLRSIKTDWEQRQQEQQVKRGEFEKILQEKAEKWNSEIQKRDSVIKEYKVNTPLISAAAKHGAVNAEQVKALLAQNVRLNEEGEVEVIARDGTVRYKDNGASMGVEDLVQEFLLSNPHFRSATPATTNTKSNTQGSGVDKLDISKLDMTKAEHRKIYAEAKAKRKI